MLSANLQARLQNAVSTFRARANQAERAVLQRLLDTAHQQALAALRGEFQGRLDHPELAWVKSALGEAETHLAEHMVAEAIVRPDGTLLGADIYELLDPHWSLSLVSYLDHVDRKAPFGTTPQRLRIANTVRLSIIGDWGTGYWRGSETPASKVACQVQAVQPDYTIHMGDVYYAGTEAEVEANFIALWPRGRQGQFALNSNHEMYSGGLYYFGKALPTLFPAQQGTSFFALSNDDWLIIGLDTAYDATRLYMNGTLGVNNAQTRFLASLAPEAHTKQVMVLSHHQPLSATGDTSLPLLREVQGALGRMPDYWYWGHLHNSMVYRTTPEGLRGRCAGHGAVPYGNTTELQGVDTVLWYETQRAGDTACKDRVLCGFVQVDLDGPQLVERFVGEDGSVRWANA